MTEDITARISELSGIRAFKGDDDSLRVVTIPFGIPNLDNILGGGAPRGRILHLSGDFGTGKTVLCQSLMKSTQREDGRIVYFNVENKYDPDWFRKTGVDVSKITVVQGNIAESVFDGAILCVKDNVDLVVIDSAAALLPIAEDEDPMSQQSIGQQPRAISKGLRKMIEPLSQSKSLVIFTNQLRSNIGGFGGDINPGGKALKFYASICLNVRRGEWLTKTNSRIGFEMIISSVKNQLAPPWKEVKVPFYFEGFVDVLSCLCMMAFDSGLIKKSGAWYTFEGVRAQGWEGLLNRIREDKDLIAKLSDLVFSSGATSESPVEEEETEEK